MSHEQIKAVPSVKEINMTQACLSLLSFAELGRAAGQLLFFHFLTSKVFIVQPNTFLYISQENGHIAINEIGVVF